MSASLAGKFQDHYDVLGVDPKADSETIQQAYSALAQKFHPNNGSLGNKEKFDAVNQAYETLADPLLRREFDKVKGVGQDEGSPTFSGAEFFDALGRETNLRASLLCILYDRRRTNPLRPSLSMRQIENMLDWTSDQLVFTLWYLKQRNMVRSDDKSSLQITVEGMDFLETNRPAPEAVMPFVKARG
jgi:curved DNA-binding protein CbpA